MFVLGDNHRYGLPIQREVDGLQVVHVLPGLEIDLKAVFTDHE